VLEEYIATRIKIESDTSLSDAKVAKLLKDMVDQSYIYQCAPGEYQTIQ
jgi:hypothetical protein